MTLHRPSNAPSTPADCAPAIRLFRDDFGRADSASVGNGWTDGSAFNANTYAPLGIRSQQVHCSDPMAPPGPEKAIGCCWRELGVVDVQATILVPPQGTHFREATPLLHVTPGTRSHGFGAWMSTYHGKRHLGFLLVGTMGNPVEEFAAVATATYPRDDHAHRLTVRSVGGTATCYFDDEQLVLSEHPSGSAVSSVTIPAELRASSMHGLAVDCHLEPEATMSEPVVADFWLESVD